MKTFLLYLIGISGSGKTTIALELEKRLRARAVDKLQFIDGDVIRDELKGLFGYTYEERLKNNRVVCVVASYLVRNGISVILAQVAGYEKMREQVRNYFPNNYAEVYVKCSAEECARRDVKGYYQKVRNGEMKNLNGANDNFEVPMNSDLVVDTEKMTLDECVDAIMSYLERENGV